MTDVGTRESRPRHHVCILRTPWSPEPLLTAEHPREGLAGRPSEDRGIATASAKRHDRTRLGPETQGRQMGIRGGSWFGWRTAGLGGAQSVIPQERMSKYCLRRCKDPRSASPPRASPGLFSLDQVGSAFRSTLGEPECRICSPNTIVFSLSMLQVRTSPRRQSQSRNARRTGT